MRRALGAASLALLATLAAAMPAPASAAICPGAGAAITPENVTEAEDALLCLVNVYRAERGVPVLTHDPTLRTVARQHSQDMIDRGFFDHVNPDGDGPTDRAQAAGYPGSVGENIAQVFFVPPSPKRFFTLWRKSPGHNSNMLDLHGVRTRTAGMGFAIGDGAWTGTQLFGTVAAGGTETGLDCSRARAHKRAKRKALGWARARAKRAKRELRRASTPSARKRAQRRLRRARKAVKKAKRQARMAGRVVKAAAPDGVPAASGSRRTATLPAPSAPRPISSRRTASIRTCGWAQGKECSSSGTASLARSRDWWRRRAKGPAVSPWPKARPASASRRSCDR